MSKEVVQIGSKIYLFPRLPFETDTIFSARKKFFMEQSPKTDKKYLEAVKMSMVFVNVKFLGCLYSDNIMEELKNML